MRSTLLCTVVAAVGLPLPSSPVSMTPAPPRLPTMRLSWMTLPLARWISTPMQKLRTSSPRDIDTLGVDDREARAAGGTHIGPELAGHGAWTGLRALVGAVAGPVQRDKITGLRFHAMPSISTGPLIGGSGEAGLITWGAGPDGSISMRKRPGAVLLRSIAQRSDPSLPSSAARVTRSTSGGAVPAGGAWAPA